METPQFDGRSADVLMAQFKRLAAWYTPEWRPDSESPDVGMALARLFAEMLQNTLSYGEARLKNHFLACLNLTGGNRKAPISAEGLVRIEALPGERGMEIPEATVLYARADNPEGRVYFETMQRIYAVCNAVEEICLTERASDYIQCHSWGGEESRAPLRLFDVLPEKNMQCRALYLANDVVFYAETRAELVLTFQNRHLPQSRARLPRLFLEHVRWQYWDGAEWRGVADAEAYGSGVRLRFEGGVQPCGLRGRSARFLRACFDKAPKEPIVLDDIRCAAQGAGLKPDALLWGVEILREKDFLPFGETPSLFDYFYIGCTEAFGKRGALVELALDMSFRCIRPGGLPEPPSIRYKGMMKCEDFELPASLELEVERVTWEYWNGLGWKRLDTGEEGETLFAASEAGKRRKLAFVCPEEIAPSEQGAERSVFLRCRPVRVGRPGTLGDVYLTPVIHRVNIGYRYTDEGRSCDAFLEETNLAWREPALPAPQPVPLLGQTLCQGRALYLRLREPLRKGPVSLFVELEEQVGAARPELRWEYFGADRQGRGGWKTLTVRDGTENLSHSGIVMIEGQEDFLNTELFGGNGYYLRIVDESGGYAAARGAGLPVLRNLSFNVVPVLQREVRKREIFSVGNRESGKVCRLPATGLSHVSVWVDELSRLSAGEREALLLQEGGGIRVERDSLDRPRKLWVQWRACERIELCGGTERVYEIDACEGLIRFGDGAHGTLPPHGETVLVEYSVSAGAQGNLEAHALTGFARQLNGGVRVDNPLPFYGGSAPEGMEASARRLKAERGCGGRAVTCGDLEELLYCTEPNISAVRCVPHIDRMGVSAPGVLSVAVLPNGFRGERTAFTALEKRVRELLARRLPVSLTEIAVFEVDYVEISVMAELTLIDRESPAVVETALRRFLEPSAREIGAVPTRDEIKRFLEGHSSVRSINTLALFARAVTADGIRDTDPERLPRRIYTVPICGKLDLMVK